jgi:hypothetical protein
MRNERRCLEVYAYMIRWVGEGELGLVQVARLNDDKKEWA